MGGFVATALRDGRLMRASRCFAKRQQLAEARRRRVGSCLRRRSALLLGLLARLRGGIGVLQHGKYRQARMAARRLRQFPVVEIQTSIVFSSGDRRSHLRARRLPLSHKRASSRSSSSGETNSSLSRLRSRPCAARRTCNAAHRRRDTQ